MSSLVVIQQAELLILREQLEHASGELRRATIGRLNAERKIERAEERAELFRASAERNSIAAGTSDTAAREARAETAGVRTQMRRLQSDLEASRALVDAFSASASPDWLALLGGLDQAERDALLIVARQALENVRSARPGS